MNIRHAERKRRVKREKDRDTPQTPTPSQSFFSFSNFFSTTICFHNPPVRFLPPIETVAPTRTGRHCFSAVACEHRVVKRERGDKTNIDVYCPYLSNTQTHICKQLRLSGLAKVHRLAIDKDAGLQYSLAIYRDVKSAEEQHFRGPTVWRNRNKKRKETQRAGRKKKMSQW